MLQQGEIPTSLWIPRREVPWLSENKQVHWARLYQSRQHWAWLTRVAVLESNGSQVRMPPCLIVPTFHFSQRRRRDPVNFMPTVKPIVDELVRMKWWTDDNPTYVNYGTPAESIATPEGVMLTFHPRIS